MSAQQNINFLLANSGFIIRRLHSANQAHARLVAIGVEDGFIRTVYDWVVDYLLFILDLIWRFVRALIIFLLLLIFRVVAIIAITIVVFYLIYKFITM